MQNLIDMKIQNLDSQEQHLRARSTWIGTECERLQQERQRQSYAALAKQDVIAQRSLAGIHKRLAELAAEQEEIAFAQAELDAERKRVEARRPEFERLGVAYEAKERHRLAQARDVERAVEVLRNRLEEYMMTNSEARTLATRLERPDAARYNHTVTRFARYLYFQLWPRLRGYMDRPGGPWFKGSWAELEGSRDVTLAKPELLGPPVLADEETKEEA